VTLSFCGGLHRRLRAACHSSAVHSEAIRSWRPKRLRVGSCKTRLRTQQREISKLEPTVLTSVKIACRLATQIAGHCHAIVRPVASDQLFMPCRNVLGDVREDAAVSQPTAARVHLILCCKCHKHSWTVRTTRSNNTAHACPSALQTDEGLDGPGRRYLSWRGQSARVSSGSLNLLADS
jgi:hypothetical protein